jgi:hypothetical protein
MGLSGQTARLPANVVPLTMITSGKPPVWILVKQRAVVVGGENPALSLYIWPQLPLHPNRDGRNVLSQTYTVDILTWWRLKPHLIHASVLGEVVLGTISDTIVYAAESLFRGRIIMCSVEATWVNALPLK